MLREHCRDGNGSPGDPGGGWTFFPREPRGNALEILQTIKIPVRALEHTANCQAKFLVWLQNVQLIAGALYFGLAAKKHKATFTAAVKDIKTIHG